MHTSCVPVNTPVVISIQMVWYFTNEQQNLLYEVNE